MAYVYWDINAESTLPRPNAPLLLNVPGVPLLEVGITYSIHYKNAFAIHGCVYKSFLSLLSSLLRLFSLLTNRSPGSLTKFSTLCAHQFAGHVSHIAHWGLEIYGLLLAFPIHKHSIGLHLLPKQTILLKYI